MFGSALGPRALITAQGDDSNAKLVLDDFERRILDEDEHLARRKASEVGAYMDIEMRKDRTLYLQFLASLAERGL